MKKTYFLIAIITIVGIGIILFRNFSFITVEKNQNKSSFKAIKALPYLTWEDAAGDIEKRGVVYYDQKRANPGANIYNSRNLAKADLINMQGQVLHSWSAKINDDDSWHHIEMDGSGNLFVIVKDKYLAKLNKKSEIEWFLEGRFHHDIAISDEGTIYTLARKSELRKINQEEYPILNEYIVIVSPKGKLQNEISLFELFREKISLALLQEAKEWCLDEKEPSDSQEELFFYPNKPPDVFHNNTIEILDRDIEGFCQKGEVLISIRELDIIAVVDLDSYKLKWYWGGNDLSRQHHPTLLDNNNVLIFDNGRVNKYSRIIELNPVTQQIEWQYLKKPKNAFYSPNRGSSQRLSNGNTLITESTKGYVFEVTMQGDVVWEFFNPEIKEFNKRRAVIYRMMRLDASNDYVQELLKTEVENK